MEIKPIEQIQNNMEKQQKLLDSANINLFQYFTNVLKGPVLLESTENLIRKWLEPSAFDKFFLKLNHI